MNPSKIYPFKIYICEWFQLILLILAQKLTTFVVIPKLNCERLKCMSQSDLFI